MIFWRDYCVNKFNTFEYKNKMYNNVVCAFDIEVTTFFNINGEWVTQDIKNTDEKYIQSLSEAEKIAVPYIWQFAINDDVVFGRELSEFWEFLKIFTIVNRNGNTIIYVHNLAYEFEFLCENFPRDTSIFAKMVYKPMKIEIPSMRVIFRCSYMLTNMSLENCAKEFNLNVEKTAELDYTIARLPNTPLSPAELHYCENDVRIVVEMIRKIFLERYENIVDIPLTQTGEVRREVKRIAKTIPHYIYQMNKIKPDLQQYKLITAVIAGGYAHLNGLYNDVVLENVTSWDKKSSYPDIMCTRRFPMGKWNRCSGNYFDFEDYAYIMRVKFIGVECRYIWAYISAHKCKSFKANCDNGKIYSAEWVEMWCTEQDYEMIRQCYKIEDEIIFECYKSFKKYLPREMVLFILEMFGNKSRYKGDENHQSLYLRSKQLINAIYGLTLSNDVRIDIVFDIFSHLWEIPKKLTDVQIIEKLNRTRPFLNFSIGAWVTAYGRRDVFEMLMKINLSAVYSDTDSIKLLHGDKYAPLFDEYNKQCEMRIDTVCRALNIEKSLFYPKNPQGIVQPLGYFENEGTYDKFKSLGAKKYCFVKNGEFNATVAGLRKKYLLGGEKISTIKSMDEMRKENKIPHGRSVHWHIVNQPNVWLTDYLGNAYQNKQKQGLAMLSTFYTFNITRDYADFIVDVRDKYRSHYRGGYFYDEN